MISKNPRTIANAEPVRRPPRKRKTSIATCSNRSIHELSGHYSCNYLGHVLCIWTLMHRMQLGLLHPGPSNHLMRFRESGGASSSVFDFTSPWCAWTAVLIVRGFKKVDGYYTHLVLTFCRFWPQRKKQREAVLDSIMFPARTFELRNCPFPRWLQLQSPSWPVLSFNAIIIGRY